MCIRFCKVAVRVTAIRPEARTEQRVENGDRSGCDGRLAKWNEDARAREIVFRARKKRYYCECRPRVYVPHSVHHFHPRNVSTFSVRPAAAAPVCLPACTGFPHRRRRQEDDRRRRRRCDVTIASSAVGAPSDPTPSRRAYTTARSLTHFNRGSDRFPSAAQTRSRVRLLFSRARTAASILPVGHSVFIYMYTLTYFSDILSRSRLRALRLYGPVSYRYYTLFVVYVLSSTLCKCITIITRRYIHFNDNYSRYAAFSHVAGRLRNVPSVTGTAGLEKPPSLKQRLREYEKSAAVTIINERLLLNDIIMRARAPCFYFKRRPRRRQ